MESIHEQVRFPPLINLTDIMADEHEVVGSHGFAQQSHMRLFGSSVALAVVAMDARGHEILPGIFSRLRSGHQVVDGQWHLSPTAVLAPMTISTKNVFAGKNDFLIRDLDINAKPDYAWKRHAHGHGAHALALMRLNEFRFSEVQQHDRLLHIANRHRLIILIEDEDLAVEGTSQTMLRVITEDSILSFGLCPQILYY